MTATTERCPGCHGSGIEMSGVTYAGMSEYVGCHECSPECPDDCGCRVSDDLTLIANEPVESCERCGAVLPPPYDRPEWAKSMSEWIVTYTSMPVAARHPGATQSPDGSPRAAEGLRGAESAVSDAEAAQWAALADAATEGPWVVDQDGSIGAPMAGLVCGEDGHPRPDCSECGTRVCHTSVMPGEPDAAFIATARTAVPRLLADRERLTGEVAQLREDLSRLASEWERELTSDHRPASALEAELDPAEFRTKPNPDQPDRCPSIDPHDTLQCTRRIHEDGQCQSGGIAWVKGTPRYMSDAERANRMEGMAERLAERLVDVEERLTGERDRARGTAAALEAENARLTEALYLTRITLEATFRVLQEASGLPDDIDDPDCRDEMVLALRPRAEKAEAENARLVDRIERLSAEYEADLPESMAGDERLRRVFDDHANDVLGLLSDEDEGGE